MTTYPDIVAAMPATGNGSKALARSNFVKRYAYALADSEDLRTITVVDPDYGVLPLYILQSRRLFAYDATDALTAHDGTTCLVSADGKRYKIDDFLLPWSVLTKGATAAPGSPAIGDSHIVGIAATGAWASKDNKIATYTSRGWLFTAYPVGKFIYNQADASFYYPAVDGTWTRGAGNLAFGTNSVPLSSIIGTAASLTIRVENQTTNTPPGSRLSAGTPSVPLSGSAANINDNSTTTTSTTSALGDLSAASIASRIIAKIDYGASKSLTAIEAKQLKLSTGTGAAGLYSSADGTTWTELGADLALTSTAADFIRAGAVTARYVAIVVNQANYAAATATVGDLNAYDSTTVATLGTAYVVGPSPFGPWIGQAGKVAICEATNSFTFYPAQFGDEVADKSLGIRIQYNGTSWISASGSIIGTVAAFNGASIAPNTSGTAAYAYNVATPPASGAFYRSDPVSLTYTAKKTGNTILIRYQARVTFAGSANWTFGVLRNSESSAIAWDECQINNSIGAGSFLVAFEWIVTAPDTNSNTYKLAMWTQGVSGQNVSAIDHRTFTIQEIG